MIPGLTDSAGRFSVLAIDHRDSLRHAWRPDDPESLTAAQITTLKLDLVGGVADLATGVMLEPEYSIPQVSRCLPNGVGFFAALEAQGYLDQPDATPTTILDGWSVEAAKACGASAAKLLLPYRPDGRLAAEQERVAHTVIEACRRIDLPIAVEPLFYGSAAASERASMVVETAQRFAALGPDLLKLPFPGTPRACAEISEKCSMPWALLSGGGSFERFAADLAVAVAEGCSGFMVGRALWAEVLAVSPADRASVIGELVRPRFAELVAQNRG